MVFGFGVWGGFVVFFVSCLFVIITFVVDFFVFGGLLFCFVCWFVLLFLICVFWWFVLFGLNWWLFCGWVWVWVWFGCLRLV